MHTSGLSAVCTEYNNTATVRTRIGEEGNTTLFMAVTSASVNNTANTASTTVLQPLPPPSKTPSPLVDTCCPAATATRYTPTTRTTTSSVLSPPQDGKPDRRFVLHSPFKRHHHPAHCFPHDSYQGLHRASPSHLHSRVQKRQKGGQLITAISTALRQLQQRLLQQRAHN